MKAIAITRFIEDYSQLRVSDIPAPVPKSDEVLVNITHSALNHVDLLYAKGLHQNNHIGLVKPPFVSGLEFAGVVVFQLLENVLSRQVITSGEVPLAGSPEQICVRASQLQRVPRGWTLHDAAGLGAATAPVSYGALVRLARVEKGQTVLVHAAAGGLGVAAVMIANALDAKVIGTVGRVKRKPRW